MKVHAILGGIGITMVSLMMANCNRNQESPVGPTTGAVTAGKVVVTATAATKTWYFVSTYGGVCAPSYPDFCYIHKSLSGGHHGSSDYRQNILGITEDGKVVQGVTGSAGSGTFEYDISSNLPTPRLSVDPAYQNIFALANTAGDVYIKYRNTSVWNKLSRSYSLNGKYLIDLAAFNDNTIFVVSAGGSTGYLYKCTIAGTVLSDISSYGPGVSAVATNGQKVAIIRNGGVLVSTDGGITWQNLGMPRGKAAKDVALGFVDTDNKVYALGGSLGQELCNHNSGAWWPVAYKNDGGTLMRYGHSIGCGPNVLMSDYSSSNRYSYELR